MVAPVTLGAHRTGSVSFLRHSLKDPADLQVSRSVRKTTLSIAAGLALLVAACGAGEDITADTGEPTTTDVSPTPTTAPASTVDPDDVPSALDDMNDPAFPEPLIDPAEIISGGPPPDGIPSIDAPRFVTVDEADEWLEDAEPVIFLEMNGETRAYPVQVMIWHEIVNDTVDDVPVTVTYCPLCNSAVSFRREVNGEVTTFGTSGRLYASALVMYDRATESLWTHFDGRAVVGALTGERLEPISSPLIAWADFKESHPNAMVLDKDATGYSRPYGQNPYAGYDDPDTDPFLFRGSVDDRAAAKQRVVGVATGAGARAYALDGLMNGDATATNDQVGDTSVVIFWKSGQASALEAGRVDSGRDVGSVGVFSPIVDGEALTFTVEGGAFVDEQTGSRWDITGKATSGELEGRSLEQIHHLDTFWFAWSTYQPETDLVGAD